MKFAILLMVLFSLVAQDNQPDPEKEIEDLLKRLKLTDEQDKTVKPMLLQMSKEMQEMRNKMMTLFQSGDREGIRVMMSDFRKRMELVDQQVMELLTDEQKLIYKEELDKRQERQRNRRRSPRRNK
ncbi:MAG: hypothetical protein KDD94_07635 [Calditrichaeota bacterium]|nr:hypothetical protein [Calditrichota bacterium]